MQLAKSHTTRRSRERRVQHQYQSLIQLALIAQGTQIVPRCDRTSSLLYEQQATISASTSGATGSKTSPNPCPRATAPAWVPARRRRQPCRPPACPHPGQCRRPDGRRRPGQRRADPARQDDRPTSPASCASASGCAPAATWPTPTPTTGSRSPQTGSSSSPRTGRPRASSRRADVASLLPDTTTRTAIASKRKPS